MAGPTFDTSEESVVDEELAPKKPPVFNIYNGMLLISLISICIGIFAMTRVLGFYGGWDEFFSWWKVS